MGLRIYVTAVVAAVAAVSAVLLPAETRELHADETLSWSNEWNTNVSSLHPNSLQKNNFDVLSTRQLEFHDMNLHSRSYSSGWEPIWKAGEAKPSRPFPTNCFMVPQGIAVMADLALMVPCLYGNPSIPPKVVFVHHLMLPHFTSHILPKFPSHYRFVLISSGTDQTIPTGSGDTRFLPLRGFANTPDGGENWVTLTNSSKIIHWFCENHDVSHPRVSTLPLGVVEGLYGMEHISITDNAVEISKRPLQFLVAHRLRPSHGTGHGPWDLRAKVLRQCRTQQEEHRPSHILCVSPREDEKSDHRKSIPQQIFVQLAMNVSFTVCVHGGGIDPSPKAWEAVMMGNIPIIQHSTLDDAYSQLPVVFIDDWDRLFGEVAKVRDRLQVLRSKLAPYYEDATLRSMVTERLRTTYWNGRIMSTYHAQKLPKTTSLAEEF